MGAFAEERSIGVPLFAQQGHTTGVLSNYTNTNAASICCLCRFGSFSPQYLRVQVVVVVTVAPPFDRLHWSIWAGLTTATRNKYWCNLDNIQPIVTMILVFICVLCIVTFAVCGSTCYTWNGFVSCWVSICTVTAAFLNLLEVFFLRILCECKAFGCFCFFCKGTFAKTRRPQENPASICHAAHRVQKGGCRNFWGVRVFESEALYVFGGFYLIWHYVRIVGSK